MNKLTIAFTLMITISAALAFGVALGHAAISALLRAMGRHSRPLAEPAPVLAGGGAQGD